MNLQEVYQAAHGQALGKSPFTWTCWGRDCWYVAFGTPTRLWAACVADKTTARVWALELFDTEENIAWRWIDPEGWEAWQQECTARGIAIDQAWEGVAFQDLPDASLALLILSNLVPPPEIEGLDRDPT